MSETREVRPELVKYLNRLSDTLYALARLAEHRHDLAEIEEDRPGVGRQGPGG